MASNRSHIMHAGPQKVGTRYGAKGPAGSHRYHPRPRSRPPANEKTETTDRDRLWRQTGKTVSKWRTRGSHYALPDFGGRCNGRSSSPQSSTTGTPPDSRSSTPRGRQLPSSSLLDEDGKPGALKRGRSSTTRSSRNSAQAPQLEEAKPVVPQHTMIEDVVSLYLKASANGGGVLTAKVADILEGQTSENFITQSKMHADLRDHVTRATNQIKAMESLSDQDLLEGKDLPGNERARLFANVLGSAGLNEEVAQRMRQIRRMLQDLHWPHLHGELRRWVKKAGGTNQHMQEYLSQAGAARSDIKTLLRNSKYQGERVLSKRELLIAHQLGKFHKTMSQVIDDVHEEKARVLAEAAGGESSAPPSPRKGSVERMKISRMLDKTISEQETVMRYADIHQEMDKFVQKGKNRPKLEKKRSGQQQQQQRAPIPTAIEESAPSPVEMSGEVGNSLTIDIDLFDDVRYGHLKRIYTKHKDKIEEINRGIEKHNKELEKCKQEIAKKLEEEEKEMLDRQKKDQSAAGQGRMMGKILGAMPPDMQKKILLRRERDALNKYLNEVVCEDVGPTRPGQHDQTTNPEGLTGGAKVLAMEALGAFGGAGMEQRPPSAVTVRSQDGAAEDLEQDPQVEALNAQIEALETQVNELKVRAQSIVDDVNTKVADMKVNGGESAWAFDAENLQAYFLINTQLPMVELLQHRSKEILNRLEPIHADRRPLETALKTSVETVSADVAARREWFDKKHREFKPGRWKQLMDKALEGLTSTLCQAAASESKEVAAGLKAIGALDDNGVPKEPAKGAAADSPKPSAEELEAKISAVGKESEEWSKRVAQAETILEEQQKLVEVQKKLAEAKARSEQRKLEKEQAVAAAKAKANAAHKIGSSAKSAKATLVVASSASKAHSPAPGSATGAGSKGPSPVPGVAASQDQAGNADVTEKATLAYLSEKSDAPNNGSVAKTPSRGAVEHNSSSATSAAEAEIEDPKAKRAKERAAMKAPKANAKGQMDFEKLVKRVEHERKVLLKKRDAKLAALRKALQKSGMAAEVEMLGTQESEEQKRGRVEKEMKAVNDQIKNLTKILGFWDQRIQTREASLRNDSAAGSSATSGSRVPSRVDSAADDARETRHSLLSPELREALSRFRPAQSVGQQSTQGPTKSLVQPAAQQGPSFGWVQHALQQPPAQPINQQLQIGTEADGGRVQDDRGVATNVQTLDQFLPLPFTVLQGQHPGSAQVGVVGEPKATPVRRLSSPGLPIVAEGLSPHLQFEQGTFSPSSKSRGLPSLRTAFTRSVSADNVQDFERDGRSIEGFGIGTDMSAKDWEASATRFDTPQSKLQEADPRIQGADGTASSEAGVQSSKSAGPSSPTPGTAESWRKLFEKNTSGVLSIDATGMPAGEAQKTPMRPAVAQRSKSVEAEQILAALSGGNAARVASPENRTSDTDPSSAVDTNQSIKQPPPGWLQKGFRSSHSAVAQLGLRPRGKPRKDGLTKAMTEFNADIPGFSIKGPRMPKKMENSKAGVTSAEEEAKPSPKPESDLMRVNNLVLKKAVEELRHRFHDDGAGDVGHVGFGGGFSRMLRTSPSRHSSRRPTAGVGQIDDSALPGVDAVAEQASRRGSLRRASWSRSPGRSGRSISPIGRVPIVAEATLGSELPEDSAPAAGHPKGSKLEGVIVRRRRSRQAQKTVDPYADVFHATRLVQGQRKFMKDMDDMDAKCRNLPEDSDSSFGSEPDGTEQNALNVKVRAASSLKMDISPKLGGNFQEVAEKVEALEISEAHTDLKKAHYVRQAVLDQFQTAGEAFKAFAGVGRNKMTRGDLANGLALMGFDLEDTGSLFPDMRIGQALSSQKGLKGKTTKRELSKSEFVKLMRASAPIPSLPELRTKLQLRFKKLEHAFHAATPEVLGGAKRQMFLQDFCSLCLEVNCEVQESQDFFALLLDLAPVSGKSALSALSERDFCLGLQHAEALVVARKLRSPVSAQMERLRRWQHGFDPDDLKSKFTLEEFCAKVGPSNLEVSKKDAAHLFRFFGDVLAPEHQDWENAVRFLLTGKVKDDARRVLKPKAPIVVKRKATDKLVFDQSNVDVDFGDKHYTPRTARQSEVVGGGAQAMPLRKSMFPRVRTPDASGALEVEPQLSDKENSPAEGNVLVGPTPRRLHSSLTQKSVHLVRSLTGHLGKPRILKEAAPAAESLKDSELAARPILPLSDFRETLVNRADNLMQAVTATKRKVSIHTICSQAGLSAVEAAQFQAEVYPSRVDSSSEGELDSSRPVPVRRIMQVLTDAMRKSGADAKADQFWESYRPLLSKDQEAKDGSASSSSSGGKEATVREARVQIGSSANRVGSAGARRGSLKQKPQVTRDSIENAKLRSIADLVAEEAPDKMPQADADALLEDEDAFDRQSSSGLSAEISEDEEHSDSGTSVEDESDDVQAIEGGVDEPTPAEIAQREGDLLPRRLNLFGNTSAFKAMLLTAQQFGNDLSKKYPTWLTAWIELCKVTKAQLPGDMPQKDGEDMRPPSKKKTVNESELLTNPAKRGDGEPGTVHADVKPSPAVGNATLNPPASDQTDSLGTHVGAGNRQDVRSQGNSASCAKDTIPADTKLALHGKISRVCGVGTEAVLAEKFTATAKALGVKLVPDDEKRLVKFMQALNMGPCETIHAFDFMGSMRFSRASTSILDLRKRLILRFGTAKLGVNAIRAAHKHYTGGQHRLSAEEMSRWLLYSVGFDGAAVQHLVEVLSKGVATVPADSEIKVKTVVKIGWSDLEFAINHAVAYVRLEGLHAALMRTGAGSLERALRKKGVEVDRTQLDSVVSTNILANLLRLLDDASGSTALLDVMAVLQKSGNVGDAIDHVSSAPQEIYSDVTVGMLLRHLEVLGKGVRAPSTRMHSKQPVDEGKREAANRASSKGKGNPVKDYPVKDAVWLSAVLAWRQLRPRLVSSIGGGDEVWAYLDTEKLGSLGLEQWVHRVLDTKLVADEDTARDMFGLLVGFRHRQWDVAGHFPKIHATDLHKAIRLAKMSITLRTLRSTLVDEFGGLPFAFEQIRRDQDIQIDDWVKALGQVWITPMEAESCFAFFELDASGALTREAYEKTMRNTDAAIARQALVEKIVAKYGVVSAAFEGLPLTTPFDRGNFEAMCSKRFEFPAFDFRLVMGFVFPVAARNSGPSTMQFADLLDALTAYEEQCYRMQFSLPQIVLSLEDELALRRRLDTQQSAAMQGHSQPKTRVTAVLLAAAAAASMASAARSSAARASSARASGARVSAASRGSVAPSRRGSMQLQVPNGNGGTEARASQGETVLQATVVPEVHRAAARSPDSFGDSSIGKTPMPSPKASPTGTEASNRQKQPAMQASLPTLKPNSTSTRGFLPPVDTAMQGTVDSKVKKQKSDDAASAIFSLRTNSARASKGSISERIGAITLPPTTPSARSSSEAAGAFILNGAARTDKLLSPRGGKGKAVEPLPKVSPRGSNFGDTPSSEGRGRRRRSATRKLTAEGPEMAAQQLAQDIKRKEAVAREAGARQWRREIPSGLTAGGMPEMHKLKSLSSFDKLMMQEIMEDIRSLSRSVERRKNGESEEDCGNVGRDSTRSPPRRKNLIDEVLKESRSLSRDRQALSDIRQPADKTSPEPGRRRSFVTHNH